jgi:hypothetical protein
VNDASGRRLRDWMGVSEANVLRRDAHRDRSDGVLLSWYEAAEAICRRDASVPELLAFAPACGAAANRVTLLIGHHRNAISSARGRKPNSRHRLRGVREYAPRYLPLRTPSPRNQPLARASSVVRARGARRATRARANLVS